MVRHYVIHNETCIKWQDSKNSHRYKIPSNGSFLLVFFILQKPEDGVFYPQITAILNRLVFRLAPSVDAR